MNQCFFHILKNHLKFHFRKPILIFRHCAKSILTIFYKPYAVGKLNTSNTDKMKIWDYYFSHRKVSFDPKQISMYCMVLFNIFNSRIALTYIMQYPSHGKMYIYVNFSYSKKVINIRQKTVQKIHKTKKYHIIM